MPEYRVSRLLLATVSALLVASLASATVAQEPSASPPLDGDVTSVDAASFVRPEGSFSVESFDAWAEGPALPRPNTTLTVDFVGDGRLEGLTGCGPYFGGYTVDGDSMGLSVVSKGPGACGARRIEEAVAFSAALDAVVSWRAATGRLELLDDTGRVRVTLVSSTRPGVAGLWNVERLARNDGRLQPPPGDAVITLRLAEDGTVAGDTGCRLLDGRYEQAADLVAIGPVETVGLPCEGDQRKAERRLLRALDEAVFWDGTGATLRLIAGDDSPLVELRLQVEPSASDDPSEGAAPSPAPADAELSG